MKRTSSKTANNAKYCMKYRNKNKRRHEKKIRKGKGLKGTMRSIVMKKNMKRKREKIVKGRARGLQKKESWKKWKNLQLYHEWMSWGYLIKQMITMEKLFS